MQAALIGMISRTAVRKKWIGTEPLLSKRGSNSIYSLTLTFPSLFPVLRVDTGDVYVNIDEASSMHIQLPLCGNYQVFAAGIQISDKHDHIVWERDFFIHPAILRIRQFISKWGSVTRDILIEGRS